MAQRGEDRILTPRASRKEEGFGGAGALPISEELKAQEERHSGGEERISERK